MLPLPVMTKPILLGIMAGSNMQWVNTELHSLDQSLCERTNLVTYCYGMGGQVMKPQTCSPSTCTTCGSIACLTSLLVIGGYQLVASCYSIVSTANSCNVYRSGKKLSEGGPPHAGEENTLGSPEPESLPRSGILQEKCIDLDAMPITPILCQVLVPLLLRMVVRKCVAIELLLSPSMCCISAVTRSWSRKMAWMLWNLSELCEPESLDTYVCRIPTIAWTFAEPISTV